MKQQARGHSSGKVIWMGEHAVVYGYPALVMPLKGSGVTVELEQAEHLQVQCLYHGQPLETEPTTFYPIRTLLEALTTQFPVPPLSVTIHLAIPLASGMGGSAATAAALTRAFYAFLGQPLSSEALFDWIQVAETVAHHRPSGVDAMVMVHQKPLYYVKGETPKAFHLEATGFLLVVDSGQPGHTRDAVAHVRENSQLLKTRQTLANLGALTQPFFDALHTLSLVGMGEAMDEAHSLLGQLGVSSPQLDVMCQEARQAGALGAKLTGGGLGGCILALVDTEETLQALRATFRQAGYARQWVLDLAGLS